MNFYWVNIGGTHRTVIEHQFLWAPKSSLNKKGSEITLLHWDHVGDVKRGDIFFCCYNQRISFLAIAQADSFPEARPRNHSFKDWDHLGNRVNVAIVEIGRKVHRDEISADFMTRFDNRTEPSLFSSQGSLKQIYMARLPADAGLYLLEAVNQTAMCEEALIRAGSNASTKIPNTTREALVMARVGQGKFRSNLIERWEGRCALTGLQNVNIMVASHIDAWALCNNQERLDVDNGLLLAPHIDRLFDNGFISFSEIGKLQISPTLDPDDRSILGLERYDQLRKLNDGNLMYLGRHRERFGFL